MYGVELLTFFDNGSFLPCALHKLTEAFGLTDSKSWYLCYFNKKENLDYGGPIPDIPYYGVNETNVSERNDSLDWYEGQKAEVFHNRRILESYCHADVTVERETCQVFRREFIQIGNIEIFLESITTASANGS